MPPFKKLAAATALAFCALLPTVASAAGKVLYLSTAEFSYTYDNDKNSSTYQTITGGIDKAAGEACDGQEAKTKHRGGAVPFMLGGTGGTATNKGALKALQDAVDENASYDEVLAYPGVLSTEDQIKQAKCFNGTENCTYRRQGANVDARDEEPSAKGWTEAFAEFDNLGGGDIVVVQSVYQIIDKSKADKIVAKIKEQANKEEKDRITFVLLLDTCDSCSYDSSTCEGGDSLANLKAITQETVFDNNQWGLEVAHLSDSTQYISLANNGSPFAEGLKLSAMLGNTSGAFMCMPRQNVIFPAATPQGAAKYLFGSNGGDYCSDSPKDGKTGDTCAAYGSSSRTGTFAWSWPELTASSAFASLIPFWQNNAVQGGACIYLGQDANIFDNGRRGQHKPLAEMFLGLPAGACKKGSPTDICPNLKDGEQCVLAQVPEGATAANPDVLPSKKAKNVGTADKPDYQVDEDKPMCTAKIWCAEGQVAKNTTTGNICCGGDKPQPTGAEGSQICCEENKVAKDESGATVCCTTGNIDNGLCCLQDQKNEGGVCSPVCPVNEDERPDCTGSQTPGTHCCTCPDGTEYKDGKCTPPVSPACQSQSSYCAAGQIVDGACGCKCNMPYEDRPYCEDGQVPAPYISDKTGAKSGTKGAVVACCKPRPSSGAPVPVNSPWALGLLGAAVAFAAARRRRK